MIGKKSDTVNEGIGDQEFTVGTSGNNLRNNENSVKMKTVERCFDGGVDREMGIISDTFEDRSQNSFLSALDKIIAPKIELAVRSMNASSGRDFTSKRTESECEEQVGITASLENAPENNNVLHVSSMNDETRNSIPDVVSEMSVPKTRLERQPHTHHMVTGQTA